MSDIYVVTRYWDNGEVCNEDFENDEYPFMAFSTSENAMEYLKHNLSRDDILGDLAGLYDDVTLFDPPEGEHYCGVWYKCKDPYSGHTVNVRFIIYNVKMGDSKKEPGSDVAAFKEVALEAIFNIGMCKCSTQEVEAVSECLKAVEALPSVTPQPKVGHRIPMFPPNDERDDQKCSCCGYEYPGATRFCSDCGAKMVEPQESDRKCHNCKHYTSGEHDGSCGSYICEHYSNWESEDER